LEQKYLQIFRDYGEDLKRIQNQYERNKDAPPIAGNIQWSRQLLRRITSPIKKFVQNPKVFHPRESKKIVERYNKLAKILIEFETLYFQAWYTYPLSFAHRSMTNE
jgi:dynein heavy chain